MEALDAMIVWRLTLPSMLKALLWVSSFVVGVVVLAVSVEKANEEWGTLFRAVRFQLVFILIWLSPLMAALAVSLSGLHRKSCGEQQALYCSGVGPHQLAPMAAFVGGLVAALGVAASEWILPGIAALDMPEWIWTAQGPVRTVDGILVPVDAGQPLRQVPISQIEYAHPRVASFAALRLGSDLASITEQYARCSRAVACVGFALMGLYFGRARRPVVWVASLCGLFTLFDGIAWTFGAQGLVSPAIAGSVLAWLWCLPVLWMIRQPST